MSDACGLDGSRRVCRQVLVLHTGWKGSCRGRSCIGSEDSRPASTDQWRQFQHLNSSAANQEGNKKSVAPHHRRDLLLRIRLLPWLQMRILLRSRVVL